jgi:primase-polymerase (primpol)-like protein
MVAARRWLLYKLVQRPGKPKPDKVPFYLDGSPRKGKLDSPEDVARFATYDQAKQVLARGGFDGVGFALGPDGTGNYWQGVDLDEIELQGLSSFANEVPGYVSLGPSRTGCHAIGYGRKFRSLVSNESGIEAYGFDRGHCQYLK